MATSQTYHQSGIVSSPPSHLPAEAGAVAEKC
jgi:hypothetical protein